MSCWFSQLYWRWQACVYPNCLTSNILTNEGVTGFFGLTLSKLSPFSLDPFRQLCWRGHPFRQLCCGMWEFLATMKITVSQKLAAVQTSTGLIWLSGEILILCRDHCVTDWKNIPKNLHTILRNWRRLSVSLKQCLKPLIAPLAFLFCKNKNRTGIFTFGKIPF